MKENCFKLTDPELREKIKDRFGESTGTYILHWYKNGLPRVLSRLLNTDIQGILYIGCTEKALYNRVDSLAIAIKSNADRALQEPVLRGHKTLGAKFFRIRKSIDIEELFIEVRSCKDSPKKDESALLERYVANFGELPALNGNYGAYADWSLYI